MFSIFFPCSSEEIAPQPVKFIASHQYESISFPFGFLGVSVLKIGWLWLRVGGSSPVPG